jgi:catechol 2,3-dioxygenase-like lactoylglutathione lyase family enzyme
MKYSVSIDVPQLDEGLRFYRDALGLSEIARPVATYVILKCGDSQIGLIEKSAGSNPAKGTDEVRRYERHWTPVHIDFHVDDFETFLAKAINAGAKCEQKIRRWFTPTHRILQRPVRQWFLRGGDQLIPPNLRKAHVCFGPQRTSQSTHPMSLSGVKRTWPIAVQMSAYDPKRTTKDLFAIEQGQELFLLSNQEAYGHHEVTCVHLVCV